MRRSSLVTTIGTLSIFASSSAIAIGAAGVGPNTPGNAAQAPGSAFNADGKAGTVYAGEQPQNSRNTASVSQYDVACLHQR